MLISTPRQYSLLYWTTMAYIVGIPNFVRFDVTGRKLNPVNLTSIALVAQAVITGYLLVVMLLLDRRPIEARKVRYDSYLWIALLLVFILSTAFAPASRLTPPTTMASILSLFRLSQWIIVFILIVALYSRTPPVQATELVAELIGVGSWIWISIVWIFLPIIPAQVYSPSEEDGPNAVNRLGGQLLHPSHVALLASVGFFYSLFFCSRGPRRWAACLLALLTLFLTGARTQEVGFLLALFLYATVLSRKPAMRWGMIGATCLALLVGAALSGKMIEHISRGDNVQTIASLNGRTQVWEASLEAIRVQPVLGYGYSVGARNAIRDHWRAAHWLPPQAHNEFIEATLDGGIVALVLVVCIYGHVFLTSIRAVGTGPCQLFLFLVFSQFTVSALTETLLSYSYSSVGGFLILCSVGVLAGEAEKIPQHHIVGRTAGSTLNTSLHGSSA